MLKPSFSPQFEIGELVVHPGINALIKDDQLTISQTFAFVRRHMSADWGHVDEPMRLENEHHLALEHGSLTSVYRLPDNIELCVITQADRSRTDVLLTHEVHD